MNEQVEAAYQLDQYGFNVVPARWQGKVPIMPWKRWQTERTTDHLEKWFGGKPVNFYGILGQVSGCVALDVDSREGNRWIREVVGNDVIARTTCAKTGRGWHYYFRLERGQYVPSWGRPDHDVELRSEGSGIILPPSIHESGKTYHWVRGPAYMQSLPPVLATRYEGE